MKTPSHHPRGMALIMAMIVVVLITLLVAGAISFTGTERAAAEVQTQEDAMSACVVAARNLFISRVRPLHPLDAQRLEISEVLNNEGIYTAHFSGANPDPNINVSIVRIEGGTGGAGSLASVQSIDQTPGERSLGETYRVTALCRDQPQRNVAANEREIEFLIKVGL